MTVKWGVIGTGDIAATFVEESKYTKRGEIAAVASRTQKSADEFAEKYDIKKAYEGYEMLVKDPDIDVIYIATPHSYHYENTILCLNNNKAVLCEKPMAVNLKQSQEMINLARENNLFFMEAVWTYFLAAIKKVKEWRREGRSGDIRFITAEFGFRNEIDIKNRLYNPELAGGALLDIGIYNIAFANLFLSGKPVSIKAAGYIGKTGVDEHNSAILEYNDGQIAQLNSSIQGNFDNNAYIYGTEGSIHIPEYYRADKAVLYSGNQKEVFEDGRESLGYNFEIEEVEECILNGKAESDIVSFQDSLKNIEVMDMIREEINLKYPFE